MRGQWSPDSSQCLARATGRVQLSAAEIGGAGRRGMKKRDASVLECVRFEVFVWGEGRVKETASQIFNSTETRTRNANLIEVSI